MIRRLGGPGIHGVAGIPLSSMGIGIPTAIGEANWWDPNGDGLCVVAAYQPKGAADQAASYTDLSGNGNNASVIVAPGWDAVNGWKFDGIDDCLDTGITPASGYSMLVQFTNAAVGGNDFVAGTYTASHNRFYVAPCYTTAVLYGSGQYVSVAGGAYTSGNTAVAGQQGYKDGVAHGGVIAAWTVPAGDTIGIGAINPNTGASGHELVYIQAMAVYDCTLTAPQVLAVATAMAAL